MNQPLRYLRSEKDSETESKHFLLSGNLFLVNDKLVTRGVGSEKIYNNVQTKNNVHDVVKNDDRVIKS